MRLVRIEWLDSYGVISDWRESHNFEDERYICISVGFLVKDGTNVKIVAGNLAPANDVIGTEDQCCGAIAIPSVSIIKMEYLGE